MKLEKYPLRSGDRQTSFEFISEGNKGLIHKLVRYQPTDMENVYNLAFGDKTRIMGIIDDTVISNNGDGEKVLSTVAATVYAFTDKYPDAWVFATGSTKARTRLYRMGISRFLSEILNDFDVFGLRNGDWEPFLENVAYDGFLVKREHL